MTTEQMGRIVELEAEIRSLRAELEKIREHENDLEDSRRAMLYMLEDLNESAANVMQAKKEWEATFDAISDLMFTHDANFRIIRANRAYREAAGMAFDEIIGRPYYEVFPRRDGPFETCLKALQSQNEEEEEIFLPSMERVFKMRFYPIWGKDGNHLYSVHILEDITEKKLAEKRLKEESDINSHLLMIAEASANTTDIGMLMKEVTHCSGRIMGCDICLSYLWDNENEIFRPADSSGLSHEMLPLFLTETLDMAVELVKKAIEERHFLIKEFKAGETGDDMPATGIFSLIGDVNSAIVIPLAGKKSRLGLIIGLYRSKGSTPFQVFTERDKKVMQGISHQVSITLEEARLYKESIDRSMELSHKMQTIMVMNEIDRSILSTLEPQEILETAVRMIAKVIVCDSAVVALVEKKRGGFIFTAGFNSSRGPSCSFFKFEDTSATDIIENRRPQYIADIMELKEPLPREKELINEGFLSLIRMPLISKGEVAGILAVMARRPSAYTPEDLSTLEKLAAQIGVALENARLISDLEELFLGTVKSLSSAIDAKSPWTAGHSERVTKYAVDIGKEMGLSEKELKDLELVGLLHDVGKIGTYESILDKPGRLTEEEYMIMKQHPGKGAEILAPIRQMKDFIAGIKNHHENYDGTGYPDGLKGEQIPLFSRILSVADSVDAMGADRPYRAGRPMDAIIAELKRCSGTQFDPHVVDAFLKTSSAISPSS